MVRLERPALREYRDWACDSRRWAHYRPRAGDIVIATFPKCGTTWTQRLVSMLVFQSGEPRSINDDSMWPDARFRLPIEDIVARLESQEHRRFLKSHIPFDGLPIYDDVKYIHVARDGRDASMSFHNHQMAFTRAQLEKFDQIGKDDETIRRPFPRPSPDARLFFLDWMASREQGRAVDFFEFELSCWSERHRSNCLLVHYNDLKADLGQEMRRIAGFLEIDIPEALWPGLIAAGDFAAMRRDGQRLLPTADRTFEGGASRFLFKGTNGRWADVLTADDLARYQARVGAVLPPACARWVEGGRLAAGDPRAA